MSNKKISDLQKLDIPSNDDLFVYAREDQSNFKIEFVDLAQVSAESANSVFVTGDQLILGNKTFANPILGNLDGNISGNAETVTNGVYLIGDQTISGVKTFDSPIVGNLDGSISGNAESVTHGVYVTGNQIISGVKIFDSPIVGNLDGNISGNAETVTHGVYLTGNQFISGIKTFELPIVGNLDGNISGNAETVTHGVYLTGNQFISGIKTFELPIVGNLDGNISGNAETVTHGVYLTGNQFISGIKTFELPIVGNLDGSISGNAETVTHGVYVTGDQVVSGIKNYSGQLLVSGHNVITEHTIYDFSTGVSLVLADIDQLASGKKTFLDQIKPSGHIVTANESGSLVITNDPNPNQYAKNNALTLGFESGVFVTGSKLYVDQGIVTDEIESLDNIIGDSGAMVITDGRDPDLFEGPDESLTLAFKSGVFVTGSKLYVDQGIVTDEIESLDNIIGDSGAMVITDGRDPDLFEGPDESLTLAFKSGVFVTGSKLYVDQGIVTDEIESLDNIIGDSGAMVITDGRDPDLFEGPDESLTLAFKSGVFVTGSKLYVEQGIVTDEIESLDNIIGDSGAMVITDGRDPDLFEGPDESLTLAFRSGVFVTGSKLYVEQGIVTDEIESLDNIIGDSGAMVITDGRDPDLFEGPDESLTLAFKSGVFITGAPLYSEFSIIGNLSGNISGNAETVTHGVYVTGDQVISGIKTFDSSILGNLDGDISGNAETVTSGVYVSGDQIISGLKTFDSSIVGNLSGNISGNAETVTDGVYTTGDQSIFGHKTFKGDVTIEGNLDATSIVNLKLSDYVHIYFNDNDSGKTIYLPLHPGESATKERATALTQSSHIIVAPQDGRIVRALCRPRAQKGIATKSRDFEFNILTGVQNQAVDGDPTDIGIIETTPLQTIPVNPNQTYNFEFSQLQHFSSGDAFLISINRPSASEGDTQCHINVTMEFQYFI